jgi:hypothetical protein
VVRRLPRPGGARLLGASLAALLALGACTGGDPPPAEQVAPGFGRAPTGPTVPPPTLAGGIELAAVDPTVALAGEGLAYGTPLPSAEAAAQALLEDPAVRSVLVRLVHDAGGAGPLAEVIALSLDGAAFFDATVLEGYLDGLVLGLTDAAGPPELVDLGGTTVRRADGPGPGSAAVWRVGDLVVVVRGDRGAVDLVLLRSLEALANGQPGSLEPRTPLPPGGGEPPPFVPVPGLSFTPFPDDEEPPEPPGLVGAGPADGRIGVIGGERRTLVWALPIADDVPTVESVRPAVDAMVQARAGGAPAVASEALGRVVVTADGAAGSRSARAFLHRRHVLVVEGSEPAQLDAVVTAWITALGGR